jgi:hypothetical protein
MLQAHKKTRVLFILIYIFFISNGNRNDSGQNINRNCMNLMCFYLFIHHISISFCHASIIEPDHSTKNFYLTLFYDPNVYVNPREKTIILLLSVLLGHVMLLFCVCVRMSQSKLHMFDHKRY